MMDREGQGGLFDNPGEELADAGVERRTALKRGLGLVPVLVTVRSRPAWAGYASLDPNYGADSQGG